MGIVFDIQRMSVHDGPGIRTTVFFKGCSLACKWCHNPESLQSKIQLKYTDEKCINCTQCFQVCKQGVHKFEKERHVVNFKKCTNCGACIKVCPSVALEFMGKEYTKEEIFEEIDKDSVFFGDDGGVTFSGGEVLVQIEFLLELLQEAKRKGYHTCVDTTGNINFDELQKIIPYTDIFLYDVKAITPEIHKKGTGIVNDKILENLQKLAKRQCDIQIRIPLIREYNATIEEVTKMAEFIKKLDISGVTLMPYHILGKSKRDLLGMEKGELLNPPSEEEMETFKRIFLQNNIKLIK